MTLQSQCVSLELSKRLDELGVKAENIFWWISPEPEYGRDQWIIQTMQHKLEDIPAYTSSELGELLRPYLDKDIWLDEIYEDMRKANYMEDEANSRAKMLIYLLENGLLTLEI